MWLLRQLLPRNLTAILWGDRARWGLVANPDDDSWREWKTKTVDFYLANQRQGIGNYVNCAGYSVLKDLDLSGKTILEIGPGDIQHLSFWKNQPTNYILVDKDQRMLDIAVEKLRKNGISFQPMILDGSGVLPLPDSSVDIVLTFYSLEHLYPLAPHLIELKRVIKSDGMMVGAIPAEGGLAWGLGRFLTSRRWLKKNTTIDPDKIICWEHPNFSDEVMSEIDHIFDVTHYKYWPFRWLRSIDFNLVIQLICKKV